MGLLDSLQIGTSALLSQQAAIQITGNNIANAATPGYTRQEAVLHPSGESKFGNGLRGGGGVQLADVRRVMDAALQQRLNYANSQMHRYRVTDQALSRVESLVNEMTDDDLSSALVNLFNSFEDLSASPHDLAVRGTVINAATTVSDRLHYVRDGLETQRFELTERLDAAVVEADRLSDAIAKINVDIVAAESGEATASTLRDQRDQLISQLSELITVNVREEENGSAIVYIGSEQLVYRDRSRGLKMISEDVGGTIQGVVAFGDDDGPAALYGGQIAGIQATRDGELAEVISRTDQLAAEIIWQVNRVHSSGTGLEGFAQVTGTYQVDDFAAALNTDQAGLEFSPSNGSFLILVTSTAVDGSQTTETTQINVPLTGAAGDMTLNDLIIALNAVDDVSASVDASGKLTVESTESSSRISFNEDSSGVLAALGINTFFVGDNATNIAVHERVRAEPTRVAAGRNGQPGDGTNAAAISMLANTGLASLSGMSLLEYQQRTTADLAVWSAAAHDKAIANEVVHESVTAQRESLSGVSLDEEAVNLMRYQRAFQGAARFITVINELLETLLGLV